MSTGIPMLEAHLITTWSWPFDLWVNGCQGHAADMCVPNFELKAQAVFLLDCGHTDTDIQTHRCHWL